MCLIANLSLTLFFWFTLFIFVVSYITYALIVIIYAYIAITKVWVYIRISVCCILEDFKTTFEVVLYLFKSLPLLTRIRIFIYIFFLVYGVTESLLDYTLNSTGGNNLPPGNGGFSGWNNQNGPNLPPIRDALPEFFDTDRLHEKCAIQLRKITNHESNLAIFHRDHTFDCAILEQSEKDEFLARYRRSGDQECRIIEGRLFFRGSGGVLARMTPGILDAIRRGR